jgi:hypothetical protein
MVALQEMGWSYIIPAVIIWCVAAKICYNSDGNITMVNALKVITLGGLAFVPIANTFVVGFLILYIVSQIIGSHGNREIPDISSR